MSAADPVAGETVAERAAAVAAAEEATFWALMKHQRIPLYVETGNRCAGCDNLRGETDGSNSPRHTRHLASHVAEALAAAGLLAAPPGEGTVSVYESAAELGQILRDALDGP